MSVTSTISSGAEVSSAIRMLDERAKGLARPFGSPGPEGDLHLVVRAGDRRVAVAMAALRSVVPMPPVTRLPSDGYSLIGLVTLGGEVVAVADLAALLECEDSASGSQRLLLVVADGDSQLALKVDAVEGHEIFLPAVARIDLSDPTRMASTALTTESGEPGLFVLHIDAALADPRLSLLEATPGAGFGGSR